MCSEGICTVTPNEGGSCDDGNDCTVGDECVLEEAAFGGVICRGDPVEEGSACNSDCGTCVPIGESAQCVGGFETDNRTCEFNIGLCVTTGMCFSGFCIPVFFDPCLDLDEDPCTLEICNPSTGECETTDFEPCSECSSCQPLEEKEGTIGGELPPPPNYECVPEQEGSSCDDSDDCTGDGTCAEGACMPGEPVDDTPVPTATVTTPPDTPTSTATVTPTETSPPDTPASTPTHTPTETSKTPTNTPGDETPSATPITPIVTPPATNSPPPPPTATTMMNLDYGDAPDGIGDPAIPTASYPTLLENDGARHIIIQGFQLGDAIDRETDGQPNITATGDDEESDPDDKDGVEFLTPVQADATVEVRVVASLLGDLDAFVDFNRNGSWADPGEKVINDLELQPGPNDLSFPVPSGADTGLTFARFRFSSAGGLSDDGLANDGEVDDYRVEIAGAGEVCVGDCNGDGMVTISELIRGVNIALGSAEVDVCPAFDANGDGAVTINELVSAVINALNGCP